MKIVHFADPHLGYAQYGFAERLIDFQDAVEFVVKQAIALKADVVTVSGDVFDMVRPPAASVTFLQRLADQLKAAGVAFYGIDGNHDPSNNDWLTVCGIKPLDIGDRGWVFLPDGVKLAGLNWCRPSLFRDKLAQLAAKVPKGAKLDVLLIHQSLAEMAGFRGVELTALELIPQLQAMGTRVVLMGDIHDYKEMELGGIRFIYPGSPEMTAIDEQPLKTFSVIDITDRELNTSVVPIPVRQTVHKFLKSEADLDTLLKDTIGKNAAKPPMLVLSYEPSLKDFANRAESVLAGKALYRLMPMKETQALDLFTQVSRQTFERKGALHNLKLAIAAFFPEGSDEYSLVTQMLTSPDSIKEIAEQYAKSKGLTL